MGTPGCTSNEEAAQYGRVACSVQRLSRRYCMNLGCPNGTFKQARAKPALAGGVRGSAAPWEGRTLAECFFLDGKRATSAIRGCIGDSGTPPGRRFLRRSSNQASAPYGLGGRQNPLGSATLGQTLATVRSKEPTGKKRTRERSDPGKTGEVQEEEMKRTVGKMQAVGIHDVLLVCVCVCHCCCELPGPL